jgi:hypothetical protein
MGVAGGPHIVTDGLVLALDAANTKSYPSTGSIWYNLIKIPSSSTSYYTLYALTYPESSQSPPNRQGITSGYNNTTSSRLYIASRDVNYYVFNETSLTWIPDSYFNGERNSGHCYDTYDGQPTQHEKFNTDFDNIHATFPNATHIIIASHAAENFWTNAGMLQRLTSIGLPDGIAGQSRPEFILAGKVNRPLVTNFAYENVSSKVASMNLALPLESPNGTLINGPTFNSNGWMELDSTDEYISTGPLSNFFPLEYHTLEIMVKSNGLGTGMSTGALFGLTYGIVVQISSTGKVNYYIYNTDSSPTTFLFNVSSTGNSLFDNKWHHIVCLRNSSNIEIYIDGELNLSSSNGGAWSGTNVWASMNGRIGDNPNNVSYNLFGSINTPRIYNRALSHSEVLQNYNAAKSKLS